MKVSTCAQANAHPFITRWQVGFKHTFPY